MKIKVMKLLLLLIVPTIINASSPGLSQEEEGVAQSLNDQAQPNPFDAMVAVAGVAPAADAARDEDGELVDPNAAEIPALKQNSPQPSATPQAVASSPVKGAIGNSANANAAASPINAIAQPIAKPSSITAVCSELLWSAVTKVQDGYIYIRTSNGRKLLMRLEQCAKEGKPFASDDPAYDTAMIALGVQDSRLKGKKGNLKEMIEGLAKSQAEVDKKSRRALRQFAKEERDQELKETTEELGAKMEELCELYKDKVEQIRKKEQLRQLTYQFAECDSEDDEAVELEEPIIFSKRVAQYLANPLYKIKKREKQHVDKAAARGDRKEEKPVAAKK